jgi:hypothetical protein
MIFFYRRKYVLRQIAFVEHLIFALPPLNQTNLAKNRLYPLQT